MIEVRFSPKDATHEERMHVNESNIVFFRTWQTKDQHSFEVDYAAVAINGDDHQFKIRFKDVEHLKKHFLPITQSSDMVYLNPAFISRIKSNDKHRNYTIYMTSMMYGKNVIFNIDNTDAVRFLDRYNDASRA